MRTRAELAAVVKRNPLGEHADNPKHHHVVFLSARPDPKLVAAVDPADYEPEMFAAARARAVHVVAGRAPTRPVSRTPSGSVS